MAPRMPLQPVSRNQTRHVTSSSKEPLRKSSSNRPQEIPKYQTETKDPSTKSLCLSNCNSTPSNEVGFPYLASSTVPITKLHNNASTQGLRRRTASDQLHKNASTQGLGQRTASHTLPQGRAETKALSRHAKIEVSSRSARRSNTQQQVPVTSRTILNAQKPEARRSKGPASGKQRESVCHSPAFTRLRIDPPNRSGITHPNIHRASKNTSSKPSHPSVNTTQKKPSSKVFPSAPSTHCVTRLQDIESCSARNLFKLYFSPPATCSKEIKHLWDYVRSTLKSQNLSASEYFPMSSATLSLKALISAKGGQIEELFVQDCDVTFAALEPVEKLVDLLGNLWLDGYSTLPTEIETKLLSFQIESESIRTYNEFYYHSIFNVQTLANITPTLIRRLHEPAQQKTHTGVLQPLPPDVQAILRNSNSVETIAKTPPASLVPALDRASSMRQTTVQRTTSKPPHHGAGNARSQSREQNRSNMVSKNARSTGFAEASSRDTSISAHLVGHVAATPSDPYTKFTVDVQYWLSAEIMDAKSQKQAKDWAPRLFGRRSVYTPYLTVVMVDDRTADTNEYRYRLIAASSICLYQDHLLFKKKQEKQAQLSHVAGTKNPSEDRKKLETGNYHYGILMNELGFEVWSIRSLLSETTTWSGFTATPLVSDDLDSLQNIKTLLHWISSIHRWGATNHKARFQNDLDMLPRSNQAHRQSLVPY